MLLRFAAHAPPHPCDSSPALKKKPAQRVNPVPEHRIAAVTSAGRSDMPLATVEFGHITENPPIRHMLLDIGVVSANDVLPLPHADDAMQDIFPVGTPVKREIVFAQALLPDRQHNNPVAPVAEAERGAVSGSSPS